MAMQVADSMSTRASGCPYRVVETSQMEVRPDHGFLGIRYVFHDGVAEIDSVLPGTPAETIALHPGDHVLSVDGSLIQSAADLQDRIFGSHAGARPTIIIERDGSEMTVRPTLIAWPAISF
jgi:S1-C subfamily serine protease